MNFAHPIEKLKRENNFFQNDINYELGLSCKMYWISYWGQTTTNRILKNTFKIFLKKHIC